MSSPDTAPGHTAHSHTAHSHDHSGVGTKGLVVAAGLNSLFAVIQVSVGIAIGSVVVLADAAHQVVDAIGLLTAMVAVILLARPTSSSMSFGWGKVDALGGFISGLFLIASIVWIAYESIERLFNPVQVEGGGVILIGIAGLAVNGLSVLILGQGHQLLAVRAARLHLLTDLAGSVLVVLTGLALTGSSFSWLDPAASLILCALVLRSTGRLLLGAVAELIDRAPVGVTVQAVSDSLLKQPGVDAVHHIHVRPLGQERTSITAHVVMNGEQSLHEAQQVRTKLSEALRDQLPIAHSTLQLECHPCHDDDC